jgi:hypothetical protein
VEFLTDFRFHQPATGRRLKQRAWEGDESHPPARIPADEVAAPFFTEKRGRDAQCASGEAGAGFALGFLPS